MSLYVGNISRKTQVSDLEGHFGDCGRILNTRIKRGYAFITFADDRDAQKALSNLNGSELCGSRISVSWSKESGRYKKPKKKPKENGPYGNHMYGDDESEENENEDCGIRKVSRKESKDENGVHWQTWHGVLGQPNWRFPSCVAKTEKSNRPRQGNYTNASEYIDHPKVLEAKIKIVVDLLRKSKFNLVYSGAGISKASGIADYGTKDNSITNKFKKLSRPGEALPTYSHHCLSNLEERGLIHFWVQQNHDGLPQKAGFPQHKMNEIHGAWFDPSNPVVQFNEDLRSDLFENLLEIEKKTELCLCLGTSLSGMNADRCVKTPAEKFASDVNSKKCKGSVIINLQFTPLDTETKSKGIPIRIWSTIDEAMIVLMFQLGLRMKKKKRGNVYHQDDKVICPYDAKGKLDRSKKMMLDLSTGSRVVICHSDASNYGNKGEVLGKDRFGHFNIRFGNKVRGFGKWWLSEIMDGKFNHLPLVNVSPKFL